MDVLEVPRWIAAEQNNRKAIKSTDSVGLIAVQITNTVILVSQNPQPDGAKYLEERKMECTTGTQGGQGNLDKLGPQCLGKVFWR